MSSENSETRSRILDVTVRMLEQHQGRGVRMGDIAKAAGLSRQAIYLHFTSRAELLMAATKHLDESLNLESRLVPSRTATSGEERLTLYVEFWGNYIPEIYGVAKALLLERHTDKAVSAAWDERMGAMKKGCQAAIEALHRDKTLTAVWTVDTATDALWTMLQVSNWENLAIECGWSTQQYVDRMQTVAKRTFVASP